MTTKEPHHIDIRVGSNLRLQRCWAGMSQTELADRLGISFQQLQKYERGANRMAASRLWDAAEALNAPVQSFFEEPDGATDRKLVCWRDDPAFVQWLAILHRVPEAKRESFIKLVRMLAKEKRLFPVP